jgi:hypothetical protein
MSTANKRNTDNSSVYALIILIIGMIITLLLSEDSLSNSPEKQLQALKDLVNSQDYEMTMTRFENAAAAENGYAHQVFKLTPTKDNTSKTLWFFGNMYEEPDMLLVRQWRGRSSLDISLFKINSSTPGKDPWVEPTHHTEVLMSYVEIMDVLNYAKSITKKQSLYRKALKIFATPIPTGSTL